MQVPLEVRLALHPHFALNAALKKLGSLPWWTVPVALVGSITACLLLVGWASCQFGPESCSLLFQ